MGVLIHTEAVENINACLGFMAQVIKHLPYNNVVLSWNTTKKKKKRGEINIYFLENTYYLFHPMTFWAYWEMRVKSIS
jgi:hypothetical protein